MATKVTFGEYAAPWLVVVAATRKPTTTRRYEQIVRTYLAGSLLWPLALEDVTRAHCREALIALQHLGLARATRCAVLAVLQALLTSAHVDDDLIAYNPALGLRKRLDLLPTRHETTEEIHALTAEELARFLHAAAEWYPQLAALFETCARAALRLGEASALRRTDREPDALRIAWQYTDRALLRPKGGRRTVEIGQELVAILDAVPPDRCHSDWLFVSRRPGTGLPLWDATWVGRVAHHIAARTGLPPVHPHMLRHTAASLWLAQGEPVEWVSRQLGHASTAFTERVYGRWIRAHNPRGLARYDALLAGRRVDDSPLVPGGRISDD